MRLLNKLVVGASSVALAAALVAGVSAPTASAEASLPAIVEGVTVNYANQTLEIKNTADKKISVSFPTVKDKKISGDKNVCTYDNPGGGAGFTVDLSTLNVTKENYIKIWGDTNKEPVVIKIPAAEILGKATIRYDGENTYATVPKKNETTAYSKPIELAVGTGSWKGEKTGEVKVNDYVALGATLRARVAGSANFALTSAKAVAEYEIKGSTTKVKAVEPTGTFPSKEIKVKVPKKAAAPKVKVDYKKGTVTLPKDAQYRVNTFSEGKVSALGDWTPGSGKVLKQGEEIDIVNGGAVDVRTKKEGKPASMYLAFNYDAQAVLKVAKDGEVKENEAKVKVTSGSAASVDLTLTYARTVTTGKRASTSGAITVKNDNKDFVYEYLVVKDDNGTTAPAADVKGAKAVKYGKDATIKFKNDAKYTVYVRRAAVSKGDVAWATKWVKTIDLTKTDLVPSVTATSEH